jgi:hypothetical protein
MDIAKPDRIREEGAATSSPSFFVPAQSIVQRTLS